MISTGEERYWKYDSNKEHFIVLDFERGIYRIEYLSNARIVEKTTRELEEGTLLSDYDSFESMECDDASRLQTGRFWLYYNRCYTCKKRTYCDILNN